MRFAVRLYGFAAAVFFLAPCTGTSQEKKAKPAEIPADEPGLVHKQLAPLAGSWDVEITYIINGKEHKGKVRCESKWILEGRFLQQDYKSMLQGKPFYVLQLVGYDNQKKKTIEIVMNSMRTGVLHSEGSISADGRVITNLGESLHPATGKPTKLAHGDHHHRPGPLHPGVVQRRTGRQREERRQHDAHAAEGAGGGRWLGAADFNDARTPASFRRARPGRRSAASPACSQSSGCEIALPRPGA